MSTECRVKGMCFSLSTQYFFPRRAKFQEHALAAERGAGFADGATVRDEQV